MDRIIVLIKKLIPIFVMLLFLVAAVISYAGPQATILLTVTLGNQVISNVSDGPDAFSPNADGVYDAATISYQLGSSANISVIIYDESSNQVRVLKDNVSESAGTQNAVWDGRNSVGDIVEDGTYSYEIVSATATEYGQITVDNKFLDFIAPEDNSIVTIGGKFVFYLMPSEYILSESNVKLYYRPQGTQDWIDTGANLEQEVAGGWFLNNDSLEANEGDVFEIRIGAQYVDLNGQARFEYTPFITLTATNAFNVYDIYSEPNAFSPNNDGDFDEVTVFFTINRETVASFKIYDTNNNLIRTLADNVNAPSEDLDVTWDGRDDSSNIQPKGEYIYCLTADDGLGTIIEKQGSVFIDNDFMVITEPVPGTTITGEVTFKAITSESVFQETNVIFYARQDGEVEWNSIDENNPPVKQPDGSWTQIVGTSQGLNADVEIRVGADYYSYDNQLRREYSQLVEYLILNDLNIVYTEVSPNAFSPNADGQYDTTEIEYRINAAASVTTKIYDSSSNLVRTLQDNVSVDMGGNSVLWDGRDGSSNLVPEAVYTYEITVENAENTISDTASGTVVVDNHFMSITVPVVGSDLTNDVTLVAVASANTQNARDVVFSYRSVSSGTWIDISTTAQEQPNGSWTVDWNVDSFNSGDYEVRVFANYDDLKGEYRSEYSTANSHTIPDYVQITNVFDSPDAFSPNSDGEFDVNTLTYDISRDSTVSVKVYDENNNLIHTLKDSVSETAGTQTAVWYGRNDLGDIVADGEYTYLIEATDTNGFDFQYQKTVAVDNQIVVITGPTDTTLQGEVTFNVEFSSFVTEGLSAQFYYRKPGEIWRYIGTSQKIDDLNRSFTWDTTIYGNGEYEIRAFVRYRDINLELRDYYTQPLSYVLNNAIIISNVSDDPDAFSPNNDNSNDTTRIKYWLNKQASVTISIFDENNALVSLLKNGILDELGNNSVEWDGKDSVSNILEDGSYTYTIEATDAENNTVVEQGNITIDNHFLTVLEPSSDELLNGIVNFRVAPSIYCNNVQSVTFEYDGQSTSGVLQPDETWSFQWDTTELYAGIKRVKILVIYNDINDKFRDETLSCNYEVAGNKVILWLEDSPDAFSPNGNFCNDNVSISYDFSSKCLVNLRVFDSNNDLVRVLLDNVELGTFGGAVLWDGKDDNENLLPDGIYRYVMQATHVQAAYTDIEEGTVAIDNKVAEIIDPLPGSSLSGEVTFSILPSEYIAAVNYMSYSIKANTWPYYLSSGECSKQVDGSWQFTLDTNTKPNRDYKIKISVSGIDRNNQQGGDTSGYYEFTIANNVSVSRNALSPNDDGYNDSTTFYYNLISDALVSITIKDADSNIVRNLKENVSEQTGANSVVWDGKDNNAQILPDGMYSYDIAIDYSSGGSELQQGSVAIDNNFLKLIAPTNGTALTEVATLQVQSSPYVNDIRLISAYYREKGKTEWEKMLFAFFLNDIGNSTFEDYWDTTTVCNGDYEIRMSAIYKDLNNFSRSEYTFPNTYTVDNAFLITDVSDLPDAFSPNGNFDFEITTISYFINQEATTTIEIFDKVNVLVKVLKNQELEEPGKYSVEWDGNDLNNQVLTDGTYTYRITVINNLGDQVQQEGTVSIDNHFMRIISPAIDSTISGKTTFIIEPSSCVSNIQWVLLQMSTEPYWTAYQAIALNDGRYEIEVDTKLFSNGEQQFTILGTYYDLNNDRRQETSEVFVFDVQNAVPDISALTVTPNPFSPDGSGTWIDLETGEVFQNPAPGLILDDEAVISFVASDYGVFDIKIADENGEIVKQIAKKVFYPDLQTQRVEFVWDGNGMQNGFYTVIVDPGTIDKQLIHTVLIDNIPYIDYTRVYPDSIDPSASENNSAQLLFKIEENAFVDVFIYQDEVLIRRLIDNQYLNSGMNYCVWDGRDDEGHIASLGEYKISISAITEYGTAAETKEESVFVSYATDVNTFPRSINPYLGQTTAINYKLDSDQIISLDIYRDDDELVKNLVSNKLRVSGEHNEIWEGKDNLDFIVADGCYYFVITGYADGQVAWQYDPSGTDGIDISHSINFTASDFSSKENEMCVLDLELPDSVYVYIRIRATRFLSDGEIIRVLKYHEPYSDGHYQFYWDGRDESGDFVSAGTYFIGVWGYRQDADSIMITGGTPKITINNNSIAPIYVRPYDNPYNSVPTPSQVVSFSLSRDAFVTARVYNSSGIIVNSLLEEGFMSAGDNELYWDACTNDGTLLPTGYYRVVIQAHYEENYSEIIQLHAEIVF